MSLLMDTSKLLPRDVGTPPKGVCRARDRLDAIVGRRIYCCGRDKNKEYRSAFKLLRVNSVPKLERRISYSWRLSLNSQAGDRCPNACSHR